MRCDPLFFRPQVYYERERGVHETDAEAQKGVAPQTLTFGGDSSEGRLHGLQPYSVYNLFVRVLNSKGEGPPSASKSFETLEGGVRLGGRVWWWKEVSSENVPNNAPKRNCVFFSLGQPI